MAKISFNKKIVTIGEGEDEGKLIFSEPTIKQWNDYENAKLRFGKKLKNTKSNQTSAAAELFDKTIEEIINLEDDNGIKITMENKDLIPPRLKARYIFVAFEEDNEEIDVKN